MQPSSPKTDTLSPSSPPPPAKTRWPPRLAPPPLPSHRLGPPPTGAAPGGAANWPGRRRSRRSCATNGRVTRRVCLRRATVAAESTAACQLSGREPGGLGALHAVCGGSFGVSGAVMVPLSWASRIIDVYRAINEDLIMLAACFRTKDNCFCLETTFQRCRQQHQ